MLLNHVDKQNVQKDNNNINNINNNNNNNITIMLSKARLTWQCNCG